MNMLEKNFNQVIVGKSYLSLILAMKLMRRGQSVLLLDDDRVEIGPLFSDIIGPVEKKFVESWAEDFGIQDLFDLSKFLKQKKYTLVLDNKRVLLGAGPSHNLLELYRKLSDFFNVGDHFAELLADQVARDQFDNDFMAMTERIGKNAYYFNNIQSLDYESLSKQAPKSVVELFNGVKSILIHKDGLDERNKWALESLLHITRGLFHKKIEGNLNEAEAFHLFISLLSPCYELNHEGLLESLIPRFEQSGGFYKSCQLREWKFHKSRPWSVELSSYEGIIHPEKMVFIGGDLNELPVQMKATDKVLRDYLVTWKFSESLDYLDGQRVVFSDVKKMGTDLPLWVADFKKNEITFRVFMEYEKGSKISFVRPFIQETLKKDLSSLVDNLEDLVIEETVEYGREVWPLLSTKKSSKRVWFPRKIKIFDGSTPSSSEKLNHVHYFGPYRETPLGLLSSLMDINETQQFL